MTPEALRELSLLQTARLLDRLGGSKLLKVVTPHADSSRAGFVAIRAPQPQKLVQALRAEGIYADSRGELLRLGPAPYVTMEELDLAVDFILRAVS
jgi:kynureninase